MSFAIVEVRSSTMLDLGSFARAAGLHPASARQLVALGLLDASADSRGELWFAPTQIAVVARIQRLRAGFSLNYAAVGLVVDLLNRIAELEADLRRARRTHTRWGG